MKADARPLKAQSIVHTGRIVDARYRRPELDEYEYNPLIEALPPLWETGQVMKLLDLQPEFKESDRQSPIKVRLQLIKTALRFFVPLESHLDLEQRISSILRLGYLSRNPFSKSYWKKIKTKIELFDQYADQYDPTYHDPSWTASGFNIVGMSGVGKSRSILKILDLYPQVISHSKYRENNFTQKQLVWLNIECPQDGGLRGLCLTFFYSVDCILRTNYYDSYSRGKPSIAELLLGFKIVASNHFLGLLAIDEIQRLSLAKSGGDQMMLNFFVALINTIGVPVMLIGTYKAISVLSGEFSQMRRGTGHGDFIWHRMEQNEEWDLLINTMWKYQYTKYEVELTPKLSNALYEESQGITDFAVKIFGLAQERAIENGVEKITIGGIRAVAKDYINIPRVVLNALKTGDLRVLKQFEDAYPRGFETNFHLSTLNNSKIIEASQNIQDTRQTSEQSLKQEKLIDETENAECHIDNQKARGVKPVLKKPKNNDVKSKEIMITGHSSNPAKPSNLTLTKEKKILIKTAEKVDKNDALAIYEALKNNGYLRPSDEFYSY